ncbi:uncharacterized protein LOC132630953 [Lycium barbarum]|uniref:uncharacterized protein LOC132630953 n=1 Tax=Lycium barbarum TaxID=112863 RepID=UPI00293E3C1E|nr:uncharacterized protein LOC132630953 [Lycium barbarum]
MWIKYCKRHSPQTVQWKGGFQVWKAMVKARDNIEQEIWWEPRSGTTNVWFENWTKLGALYHIIPDDFGIDEGVQDVKELMLQVGWNIGKLQQLFPMDIVDHILEELHFHEPKDEWDMPRWMMTASDKFTVGTTWELLRSKVVKLWKYKIPVGVVVRRIGVDTEATCYCCDHRQYETVDHLFVTGNVAIKVWTYVKTAVVITAQFQQVRQLLQIWWNTDCPSKFRTIFKAIPMVTMWQIWKWRNTVLHGGRMSINKVIYEINMVLYNLCRMRGNPGPSSVAFCIRNEVGDFQYAAARRISDGSNLIAEARALHEGLKYCVTHSLLPMVLETDSMTMKMILTGQWETPWSISMIINDISRLRMDKEVRVEHVLREGNGLADFLTNYAFDFAGDHRFQSFTSLPVKARKILYTENSHIPYMRIRLAKDHYIPGD